MSKLTKERARELRLKGLSFESIGDLYGISRQRVFQIYQSSNQYHLIIKDDIKKRDDYKCQYNGDNCRIDKDLIIHHIDLDQNNNNPNNLLTVCVSCHTTIHNKKPKNSNPCHIKLDITS